MSKRVTTQSTITDKNIAALAFKACGIEARELSATEFEVRAGRSVARLDLRTGNLDGDDMSFRDSDFDGLRQHYAKEKYLSELTARGASIQLDTVNDEGDFVIVYQVG